MRGAVHESTLLRHLKASLKCMSLYRGINLGANLDDSFSSG